AVARRNAARRARGTFRLAPRRLRRARRGSRRRRSSRRSLCRLLLRLSAVPIAKRHRDVVLVDALSGRLHVEAGALQHRDDLLAGDPAFLGYLVNSLLCHPVVKSRGLSGTVTEARSDLWKPWRLTASAAHSGLGQR